MEYDSRTALIVVDVQHDFADPDGSLYVARGEEVIPFINEQVDQAAASGAKVIYSQDWHPAATPHFEKDGGIWPVHCVGGSTG
ncbi:MAG TPA: isochorismatase family protein, partial [Acidimicrobiia bacterium]